jgi:molybdopterin converting factor small subunit
MPKIKLKISHWLGQCSNLEQRDNYENSILVPEGEVVLGMIRRLAEENNILCSILFDEKDQEIKENVLVILNGRIVNPYDRSEALLKEGDEVMLVPMVGGG